MIIIIISSTLSNLLKRETASGWLGTQWRQENDVTWWQGLKRKSRQPNNKTKQQKQHKITTVHTTQKNWRKATKEQQTTPSVECRHKNDVNLQNSFPTHKQNQLIKLFSFTCHVKLSKTLLAMSNYQRLYLPCQTRTLLFYRNRPHWTRPMSWERVEFRTCFLVVPQSRGCLDHRNDLNSDRSYPRICPLLKLSQGCQASQELPG